MNKQNRKDLERALNLINQAMEVISAVKEEEEEKYDNLPEGIQDSERGESFQENIDNLDYAISDLDSVIEYVDNVINRKPT
jgi:prefoldin subunit 5